MFGATGTELRLLNIVSATRPQCVLNSKCNTFFKIVTQICMSYEKFPTLEFRDFYS